MTTPERGENYASDRHLLLKEIKSLSKEVSRLRGEARGLVKEEVRRNRRKNLLVGLLAFAALALPLTLFFITERRDEAEDRAFNERVLEFERATVEACQIRNRALENDARFAKSLITAFEGGGARNPEFLEIVRDYRDGLGELVDCSKRERLLER